MFLQTAERQQSGRSILRVNAALPETANTLINLCRKALEICLNYEFWLTVRATFSTRASAAHNEMDPQPERFSSRLDPSRNVEAVTWPAGLSFAVDFGCLSAV